MTDGEILDQLEKWLIGESVSAKRAVSYSRDYLAKMAKQELDAYEYALDYYAQCRASNEPLCDPLTVSGLGRWLQGGLEIIEEESRAAYTDQYHYAYILKSVLDKLREMRNQRETVQ